METKIVYVVTSYGKVKGVYADSKDAFDAQMLCVNKGQIAELIPCPLTPSSFNAKKS